MGLPFEGAFFVVLLGNQQGQPLGRGGKQQKVTLDTAKRRSRWERVAEMPETIIVDDILEARLPALAETVGRASKAGSHP